MKTHILFFLTLLLSSLCFGQEGKMFTTDNELSSSMINNVYQDKDGIIWIATEDGLNKYDGAKFTVYKNEKNNPASLQSDYVRVLFEDSKGRFFVGTLNGLQTYDRATNTFTTVPMKFVNGGLISPNVAAIVERQNGEIVIGTAGHNIFLLEEDDKGALSATQTGELVPSYLITCMYEDKRGYLWIATDANGIFRIDKDKQSRQYLNENGIAGNTVFSICEDEYGNLYVGSLKNGLYIYRYETDTFTPIAYPPNPNLPIKILYPINRDEICIGTDGNGMKIYDIREKEIKEGSLNITAFNLNKSKIHSILKDRMGNTWLGFFQKGVMILPATTNEFKYIGYKSSLHNTIGSNCVMSVCKDHKGTLWVGTDNDGIYGIAPDGTQIKHFAPTDDPHSVPATIMSIFEDSEHNLWVGSYLNGMALLNPETGHCEYLNLRNQQSNLVQNVYCITEDNNGVLWIGTMGAGLYHMNIKTGQLVHCNTPDANDNWNKVNMLHNSWINSLLYTGKGKLYIGTYDGLGCLDVATMDFVSTFNTRRLLAGDVIYALHEDEDGDIWIGTSKGLKHLNQQTGEISEYTMEDGLPSNFICAIKGDRDKYLWISTNYGISRFDMKSQSFINFYASDGLQGNEFSKGAAFVSPEGEFTFGGTNGITYFNPSDITNPNKQPEIRITDFYIHDRMVRKGMKSGGKDIVDTAVMDAEHFRLSHKDNSFSIEFSAMELYSPERITYMYALNNNKWSSLQQGVNRVSFSDLAPGTYHFRVKAKDYTSYSDTKDIIITISPAWYASGWAKIVYILFASVLIYIIIMQIRHRIRAKQEILEHIHAEQINEAKLQFFINISHEIRTPMSLIISPLQKLLTTDKDAERQKTYSIIYRNAERILRLVNQLMDIRKIDKGLMNIKFQEMDVVGFIRDLQYTFEQQARAKRINLNFKPEANELNAWIDPKNFDKIIMNILSNALKFTPEDGEINIYLHTGEDSAAPPALKRYFEIVVEDSGIGINPAEMGRIFERFYQIRNSHNNSNIGTGIGLHLSRSLVELHYGTIRAENNEGKPGSRFIIRLPLGKEHLKPEEIDEYQKDDNTPVHTAASIPALLPAEEEEEKVRSRTKLRVLVVEDDEEIRKYIRQELSSDFHMQECNNGKEALATILKKAPDLVITDIMMAEMDGLTLCRKIKQNVTINHIPVILLTAKSREEDKLEGLETGADAYIVKPFNIEILRKTAFNLMKSREMLRNNFTGNQVREDKLKKLKLQSPDDKLLSRVMKVINDNISNPDLNVEMIAVAVGISRVHLHRKLKELTSQSTRDLIRNVRLKQAALLLTGKYHSITEVASLTGFANLAYFSTAFKDLYGVSPKTYMEERLNSSADTDEEELLDLDDTGQEQETQEEE